MHRSGTSCLTGSLQEAGVNLGECHTWNPFNLKGNRENQEFVDLHDDILASNGGAWDRPPARVSWSQEHESRARHILAHYRDTSVLGFKDPRTLLVLEGWKAITDKLEFVGIFRHPNAVAGSLERRSQMGRKDALSLWYRYNAILYAEYRHRQFPILCFDDPEELFQGKLDKVIAQLGLVRSADEQRFYDSELKLYDDAAGPRVPWKIGRLYRRLRDVSL
jgi:hypothetical protein